MADAKWTNMNLAVREASDFMASQTKIELQAKRPRRAIRASWKKTGSDWTPVSVRSQTIRKSFSSTGNLVRSVEPVTDPGVLGIRFDSYGEFIIQGRKPGKGIPPRRMQEWIKDRRIKPRDPGTGEFIKATKQTRRAMSFMMNRKIKHFGIDPFDFVAIARNTTLAFHQDKINKAIKQDITEILSQKFNVKEL